MHSQKYGYIIIDCNTTSLDLQPLLFLLEYSSVLCITLSGNKDVPLSRAYHETLKILSMIGRYDVPVIRRSPSGVAAPAHCLSRICARFPHKVSVVCLGPLTNLAVALQLSRKFEKNVKRIVCVADGFNGRRMTPNWNFKIDLEAAGQVLMSKVPIVLLPGSLSCSVPISSYLTVREGTNGLFSSIFDCNDPVVFKASQWEVSRGVSLQKVVTALVAMKPKMVLRKRMTNFREDKIDKTENSDSFTASSTFNNHKSTLTASALSYSWSSQLNTDSFSSDIFHCIDRYGDNVLIVEKIKTDEILKFYKHIYLLGSKSRSRLIS